jgi:Leucine-rich repeat (LRR) protein
MRNLVSLNFSYTARSSYNEIGPLTLSPCSTGFRNLVNLTSLSLENNGFIGNDEIQHLTKLVKLNLCSNQRISDESLALMTNLTDLDIGYNPTITDDGVKID